jgi:N-glycosylase/DNA lyase
MNELEKDRYSLVALGKYIELTQLTPDTVEITCDEEEYEEVWKNYFDMGYDYHSIVSSLLKGEDEFLKNAAEYGKGLRILKQDIYETLITFIISQRKSIPAIKTCVEALSRKYGQCRRSVHKNIEYYTFPSPEELSKATKAELREAGLGYRDDYIIKTTDAIAQGTVDLKYLQEISYEESIEILKTLSGVGIKVANCVALFSLHHIDAFPIDVWIDRILNQVYQKKFNINQYSGFAGIVQQYMFYYARYNLKQIG